MRVLTIQQRGAAPAVTDAAAALADFGGHELRKIVVTVP
jgi:hypothetical protein